MANFLITLRSVLYSAFTTKGSRLTHAEIDQNFITLFELSNGGESGIIAYNGGGQASATPLTKTYNRVDLVQNDHDSVLLQPAVPGQKQLIQNYDSINNKILDVFPDGSDFFPNLSSGEEFELQPGQQLYVFCFSLGEWSLI